MSNYFADLSVRYKDEEIASINRRVTTVMGLDCVVYQCKFYPVKLDYKHGKGLYINLHEGLKI